MGVLSNLQPTSVFRFFEDLCAIPHGSGNTKAISDYCVRFAEARGLEHYQDALNNVIIIKEASAGYENAPALILQGHLDMVCEKESGCTLDMSRDGLQLAVDGDWVYARGTTLGGDDGIAIAMSLAVLDDDTLPHPRLEAVFTVDEETGMFGAAGIDLSMLQGRRMLNLDSEAEGVLTVSCAGGLRVTLTLPVVRKPFAGQLCQIRIDGLSGGHSGVEINKGRASSNELMGRFLGALSREIPIRLISVDGGLKDNAIPHITEAFFLCSEQHLSTLTELAAQYQQAFSKEFRSSDPDVRLTLRSDIESAGALLPMDAQSSLRVILLLQLSPQGVQVMSRDIDGLVQTSLNMGILKTEENQITASYSVRSSAASQKEMLLYRLEALAGILGGSSASSGDYPAWEYQPDSPLRTLMEKVYQEQYGTDPKIEAIHAGLECGLLSAKLPGLDCVSFGPDLLEIHTARERMSISSVGRVWKYLLEIIRQSNI